MQSSLITNRSEKSHQRSTRLAEIACGSRTWQKQPQNETYSTRVELSRFYSEQLPKCQLEQVWKYSELGTVDSVTSLGSQEVLVETPRHFDERSYSCESSSSSGPRIPSSCFVLILEVSCSDIEGFRAGCLLLVFVGFCSSTSRKGLSRGESLTMDEARPRVARQNGFLHVLSPSTLPSCYRSLFALHICRRSMSKHTMLIHKAGCHMYLAMCPVSVSK